MIPYSIFACELLKNNHVIAEIRALDMAEDYFTFRLAHRHAADMTEELTARLHFYQPEDHSYRTIEVKECRITLLEQETCYDLYRFSAEDSACQECSRKLIREYMRYIDLKLSGDDAVMAKTLTGYDVDEDRFAASFEDQKRHWFGDRIVNEQQTDGKDSELTALEFGAALDRKELWELYEKVPLEEFREAYFRKNGERVYPVRFLYIGNSFCPHLFPDKEEMERILTKALREQVTVFPVFSPMCESDIPRFRERLTALEKFSHEYDRDLEIIVNDEGMLAMLQTQNEFGHMKAIPGILLQKKLKDARLRWERKEWPAAANLDRIPVCAGGGEEDRESAQFYPYYQMNTAVWCTLSAMMKYGDRGRKEPMTTCPGYCKHHVFFYPRDLRMVGIGNTIYGVVIESLLSESRPEALRENGVRRIIFNYQ